MGLFDSEEKKKEKQQAMLKKYRLTDLSNADDLASVTNITYDIVATGFYEMADFLLKDNNALLRAQLCYEKALMEQNFIMIRQLDRISKAQKAIAQMMYKQK